jgi:hypothetical protein
MVSNIFQVKIKHDISRSVSHLAALEIQFYLINLPLLVRVGVDRKNKLFL